MIAVRTLGSLLPADILAAALDGTLPGMTGADYHLAAGETPRQAASRSWTYLQGVYRSYRGELAKLPPGQTGTALTREKWLLILLRELDYGRVPTTPGGHLVAGGKEYPLSHLWADVPMHLLGWGLDLDSRTEKVAGAARAPQSMVQEFLNRSEAHLWAVLSNGRQLRLLRDNSALVGQAYVEFDLEAIFEDESFTDYALLWLVCHQSRLERLPGPPDETGEAAEGAITSRWLEHWRTHAIKTGTRALAQLRGQVTKAIEALGTGFLQHPGNDPLRAQLATGEITAADLQRSLLRTVYRLLFWFVAEDRGVLLDPAAPPEAVARYDTYFASARLRGVARRRVGTRHTDRWAAARIVLDGLGAESGRPELALPGLGGLFEPSPLDATDDAALPNTALLGAVRLLSTTREKDGARLRAVDFRNLGAEELGGIYEALLELHPRIDPIERTFTLIEAAGNERKKSGSYYTPSSLIALLLDTALQPLVDQATTADDPETALLALTVCDPACGSGHFLVAAARRIAIALAAVRHGETEPTPTQVQAALRDVVGVCIHGVDLNPMAAELAKVSLWLEALEPGKPLAFLDANIRVGNALIGTTPALLAKGIPDEAYTAISGDDKKIVTALRKRNKSEREQLANGEQQLDMFEASGLPVENARLAWHANSLRAMPTGSLSEVHFAQARMRQLEDDPPRRHAQLLADVWCAAFMQPKTAETATSIVTTRVLRRIAEANPERILAEEHEKLFDRGAVGGRIVAPEMRDAITDQANRYRFFHWHLEFPHIFPVPETGTQAGPQGWDGGFDLVLGNPPWDSLSPDRKEFFAVYSPGLRTLGRDEQAAAIAELMANPAIRSEWDRYERDLLALTHFLKSSGRYVLYAAGNLGKGDFNVYRSFIEHALSSARAGGRAAQVVPAALYGGANTTAIRRALLQQHDWEFLAGFHNKSEAFFPNTTDFKFCIYAVRVRRGPTRALVTSMGVTTIDGVVEIRDRAQPLSLHAISSENPETWVIPESATGATRELASRIAKTWPPFGTPRPGLPQRVYQREVDMGNDRDLFVAPDQPGLPVYEGRMIDLYDYRAKGWVSGHARSAVWRPFPFADPGKRIQPQWRVPVNLAPRKVADRVGRYRIGFADVASARNSRTLVMTLLPPGAVAGHKVPTIRFANMEDWALLLTVAVADTFVVDFVARTRVTTMSMSYTILDSLPIARLTPADPRAAELARRALRLIATGPEMNAYHDYVLTVWPELATRDTKPAIEEHDRLQMKAEVEVIVARDLYGLSLNDMDAVLATFPAVKRSETRAYGEFRSQRLIHDAWASLATPGEPEAEGLR